MTFAQVSYDTQQQVYTQNFNSLPATGSSFTWTNNSTILGWHVDASPSFNYSVGVTTGSTTTGNIYSLGSSSSSDRALGSIASGSKTFYYGVKLVNNTGATLTSFTVSVTGEQWRRANTTAQGLTFAYSFDATSLKAGTYQTVSGLGFTSPVTGGTAGAIDGNATANRTVIGPVTVDNINWAAGTAIWLRFVDVDDSGSDHGLAIDDFSFTAAGANSPYAEPAGYYNSASGHTGEALITALHSIVGPHTVIPYTSGTTDTWDALKALYEDPSDSSKIKLLYSGTSVLKTDSSWNREHLWPQSRGIDSSGPDYSDLFNLRPVLGTINSARSNKIFDDSNLADPSYASPAASGAASDTSSDSDSWQPRASERGDIARALFYMDTAYDGSVSGTSDLVLTDEIAQTPDMAVLSTLIEWHQEDPVSFEELVRNATIYSQYQGNRNPFVDHPEFVALSFGNIIQQALDEDQDGMPGYWEVPNLLDPDDPADANEDADGDGFSNFEESWMGSDPQDETDPVTLIVDGSYTGSVENGSSAHPFKKIGGAVDAVPANQRRAILVRANTYPERVLIDGKNNIFLFSESGAAQTIIDGQGVNSSVVRMYDFQRAAIVGFTIQNANTSSYGAGLRVDAPSGSILIAENDIRDNVSTNGSEGGGGLYLKTAKGSRVINNFIVENTATRGGGVFFAGGDADFWFNTVAGNTATGGDGGGLSALQSVAPDVRNNILWGNTGSNTAQMHQISITAINNILQGAGSGTDNIDSDPLFVGSGDYHISATSPAINAGVLLPVVQDFDHAVRSGARDIGADEISGEAMPDDDGLTTGWEITWGLDPYDGDQNNNGIPDGEDDFDGDGVSNYQEYLDGTDPLDPGSVLSPPDNDPDSTNQTALVLWTPFF